MIRLTEIKFSLSEIKIKIKNKKWKSIAEGEPTQGKAVCHMDKTTHF